MTTHIVVALFDGVTALDFVGPTQVFGRLPDTDVSFAAASIDPVTTDGGWTIGPSTTFVDCPAADVLLVPGGPGTFDVLEEQALLSFLRDQALTARWITSVCTGSFALAAAGLLAGRRATSHWASLEMLREFDVTPVAERVVTDGNRMTGAGVSAGIDFALTLAAAEYGEDVAKSVQLWLEYDPAPPFSHGSPRTASAEIVREGEERMRDLRLGRVQSAASKRS